MTPSWIRLASDMTLLGFEAHRVISLRMATIALGGARAQAEAQRMMVEKMFAAARVWQLLMFGHPPQTVVRELRSRVRANQRRLSRL
jgi:hypothetical protein